MNKVLGLCVVACVVAGCATAEKQTFSSDPIVRPGAQIELGMVSIPPGKTYEIDAATLMRTALEKSLAERGIGWKGEADADRFVLDVLVDDYEPGNAFKRWLAPGFGSTIVHVSGKLTDRSTGEVAGELDYEQGVHWGGAYSIGAWATIFQTVADDITKELENRIENKGFVVTLKPWPARDIDIPIAPVRQQFTITNVKDARPDRGRIGERFAAFEVSMGDVFFYRTIPAFMEEAITSELMGAGHQVTNDEKGRPVSLEIVTFWAHTDTTTFYWDVVGNIEIALAIGGISADQLAEEQTFSCESTERTYVYPSLKLVTGVMDSCLVELMSDLRKDPIWQ